MARIITKETRPGRGVSKNEPEKRRFFQFFELYFNKFFKLIQLNFIYFICLLPLIMGIYYSVITNPLIDSWSDVLNFPPIIFTPSISGCVLLLASLFLTGPATAGFTYVIRNMSRKEHSWVISDFFEHFKKNFAQGIAMSVLDMVCYPILYIALMFYMFIMPVDAPEMGSLIPILGSVFVIAVTILYTWAHFYIYTIMVTFKLDFGKLFRNSLIFAIAKLPLNLLITFFLDLVASFALWTLGITPLIAGALLPTVLLSFMGLIVIFSTYPTIDKNMVQKVNQRVLNTRI